MSQLNIDSIIDRLLAVRGSVKPGKPVTLEEKDIITLLKTVRHVFLSQPILLELAAPVKICGSFELYFRRHPRPVLRPAAHFQFLR